MNSKSGLILTLLMAVFLTACAGKKKDAPVAVDDTAGANTSGSEAYDSSTSNPWGVPNYSEDQLRALGITENPLNYKVVYFQYNSSSVDERSRIIIDAHARNLGRTGGAQVGLEGHADERGTRDYNLALGERRAQEVGRLLNAGGASSTVQTISYGEERPVDTGHSESAWQQNRRVAINY